MKAYTPKGVQRDLEPVVDKPHTFAFSRHFAALAMRTERPENNLWLYGSTE